MVLQTLSYKPLYQLLADHLQTRIMSGEFPCDSFLPPMRSLMRTFSVSLATVRGALELLEERDLVKRHQGSGIRVIHKTSDTEPDSTAEPIDLSKDIKELFSLRLLLEPAALDNGFSSRNRTELQDLLKGFDPCSRDDLYLLDRTLHEQITGCPNRYLRQALSDTMNRIELYREIKFRNIDTAQGDDVDSIRDLAVSVIENRKSDALKLLKEHIIRTRDGLLNSIKE